MSCHAIAEDLQVPMWKWRRHGRVSKSHQKCRQFCDLRVACAVASECRSHARVRRTAKEKTELFNYVSNRNIHTTESTGCVHAGCHVNHIFVMELK